MKILSTTTAARLAAVVLFLLQSNHAVAQATVRDSAPINSGAVPAVAVPVPVVAPTSTTTASSPQGSSSFNPAYQIQQLQQEILELRGLVEEQGFELKRLKQQRLDDYLDLDKRLGELSSRSTQTNAQANTSILDTTSLAGDKAADTAEEEKKLYRDAIDKLLNQQDYQSAQQSFSQYLTDYPQGIYTPNVYYWQGQIYLTEAKQQEAEKSFVALTENYPDHQKTPDAKYKLATIYFDQGRRDAAKTLLDDVAASDSDASRLAKSFLDNQYQ